MKIIGLALILSFLCSLASAQENQEQTQAVDSATGERYVRDYLFVPVRSGASAGHRVVHKGLKSGTQVTLLGKTQDKYTLIKTSKGLEGWVLSQYLVEKPTAALLLKQARQTIEQLSKQAGPISENLIAAESQNRQFQQEIKQLTRENKKLTKELERIKDLSSNAISLDQDNNNLRANMEQLKNSNDTLNAENQRLEQDLKHQGFMNGVLAVLVGVIITFSIQYLTKSRGRSEWA